MLNFKPLLLEDYNLLNDFFKPYIFKTSAYSYTNLFIWRTGHNIEYTIYKNMLILKETDFNNHTHFMQPIGYSRENLTEIIDILIEAKKDYNIDYLFKNAETEFVETLKEIYPDKFEIYEDRDNFDYIYESSKLISLSGKNLHSKKNHYNNFVKNNEFYTVPITRERMGDCIELAREWCVRNDCIGNLLYELKAIEELLNNSDTLPIDGMAVYVDGKLSAFTIGEKMNDEMAIIHIEKASAEINGLYAFINKTFVETYYSEVTYINREQDLGLEGLRKAKLSYHPFKLEQKFIVK